MRHSGEDSSRGSNRDCHKERCEASLIIVPLRIFMVMIAINIFKGTMIRIPARAERHSGKDPNMESTS